MIINTIQITKFPLVIITDTHCNINLINKVKSLYPHSDFICLGDITNLFSEIELFNKYSINYFIENQIPCIEGNHESFIKATYSNNKTVLGNVLLSTAKVPKFNLDENVHVEYLKTLPRGFKLILPNGFNYLCFHNRPDDLWSFTDQNDLNDTQQFLQTYPCDVKTIGVIHGHGHKSFIKEYKDTPIKRYSLGSLKFKEYTILDESGLYFKQI